MDKKINPQSDLKLETLETMFAIEQKKCQSIRFGQWFLNFVYPSLLDSELFYCKDHKKCLDIIKAKFIDSHGKSQVIHY